jgi:hypothetical protein
MPIKSCHSIIEMRGAYHCGCHCKYELHATYGGAVCELNEHYVVILCEATSSHPALHCHLLHHDNDNDDY